MALRGQFTTDVYYVLLEWSRLRNALLHCPPKHFRPVALDDEDINEYFGVVKPLMSSSQIELVEQVIEAK